MSRKTGEVQEDGQVDRVELVRSQSSVEIALGSKGTFTYAVKAYADNISDAVSDAIAAASKVGSELKNIPVSGNNQKGE